MGSRARARGVCRVVCWESLVESFNPKPSPENRSFFVFCRRHGSQCEQASYEDCEAQYLQSPRYAEASRVLWVYSCRHLQRPKHKNPQEFFLQPDSRPTRSPLLPKTPSKGADPDRFMSSIDSRGSAENAPNLARSLASAETTGSDPMIDSARTQTRSGPTGVERRARRER